MPGEKILNRGAEAVLYLKGGRLMKERLKKGYRIEQIDEEIRRLRSKKEARLLERARRAGIKVPDAELSDKYIISMDYIEGEKLKDALSGFVPEKQERIAEKIGVMVARLHSADIVHGDLTTSNMILKGEDIYLIDLGLGKVSLKVEDRATDLFLLQEALISTHFRTWERIWKKIINTYALKYSDAPAVLKRLEKISARRRYK